MPQPGPLPLSTLTFTAAAYPIGATGRDVLFQTSTSEGYRLEVARDETERTATARLARGPEPQPDTPDVLLESVLIYSKGDTATEIGFSLIGASLPPGSQAAVSCVENPDISIPPTKVRNGRFASVGFDPADFDKPLTLQLKFWLKGQPLLAGGSLAFDVTRLTTEDQAGPSDNLRDPESGLPVASLPDRASNEVSIRIGQLVWALLRS